MQQPTTTKRIVMASVLDYVDDKYTEVSGCVCLKTYLRCPELLKMPVIGCEIAMKIVCFYCLINLFCMSDVVKEVK